MTIKKIIFVWMISLSFILVHQVSAARLVPKNAPLQPIPQGSAPNVSNNINSSNSNINTNLQSQIPAVQSPDQTPASNSVQTIPTDQNAPIVGNVSTTSTTFYWFLLIVGLAGLVAAGIWSYLRFVYKSK